SYLMGVPFVETKLTGKSSTGCKGKSLDTFFEDVASHRNEPGFKRSVVLLDESDKIRPPTNGWDAFESRLQNELIGWVESATVRVPLDLHTTVSIDTTDMLFIGAGAFTGLGEIIASRLGSAAQGIKAREIYAEMLPEDLVEYGFKAELVGRFPVLTYVKPLEAADLVDIMKNGKRSALRQQIELLKRGYGVDVVLEEPVYAIIADAAIRMGTGARALETISNKMFHDIKLDIRDWTRGGKTTIHINEEVARKRLAKLIR
ncbi:MAG: AAA family ATPase, partial [Candidatus ainarchaeum sp.]|nr:AAA family ATPase [Candidatus ainarchaeum sp.]